MKPTNKLAIVKIKARKKKRMQRRVTLLKEGVTVFLNGLLFKNPVVIGALGLYPVAAAAYNLRNAAALAVLLLVMMLPTCLASCWIGDKIPHWIRPAVVLTVSAVCYVPASIVAGEAVPNASLSLGIYAPLMIGNSIILSRANDYAPSHISFAVLADSLGCTAGFAAVVLLVGGAREILSLGTLWGAATGIPPLLQKPATYPFMGFLMIGFLAALVQLINGRRARSGKKVQKS